MRTLGVGVQIIAALLLFVAANRGVQASMSVDLTALALGLFVVGFILAR